MGHTNIGVSTTSHKNDEKFFSISFQILQMQNQQTQFLLIGKVWLILLLKTVQLFFFQTKTVNTLKLSISATCKSAAALSADPCSAGDLLGYTCTKEDGAALLVSPAPGTCCLIFFFLFHPAFQVILYLLNLQRRYCIHSPVWNIVAPCQQTLRKYYMLRLPYSI